MKRNYRYLVYAGLALVAAACMTLVTMNHPDSAPVNTGVDVSLEIEVKPAENGSSKVLVGILAPEVWNLNENAEVSYTTGQGAAAKTVTMHAASAEKAPSGKTWAMSLRDSVGTYGNFEPVEWVAFIADADQTWENKVDFTGRVNIKFTTGSENLKVNLGYVVSNVKDAADVDVRVVTKKLFTTTGGENATIDYTMPKVCTVTPEFFSWEDIVAIHTDLSIQINDADLPLKGADKVYLMARATYDGGQEAVVDVIGEKTLMETDGKDKWVLYIYPHEFFNIPAGKTIEKISVYMVNEDKSLEVKTPDGGEFPLTENNR